MYITAAKKIGQRRHSRKCPTFPSVKILSKIDLIPKEIAKG